MGQVVRGFVGTRVPGGHLAVRSGREGLVGTRVEVDTWE